MVPSTKHTLGWKTKPKPLTITYSTPQVLKQADPSWFVDGLTWRQVYGEMREVTRLQTSTPEGADVPARGSEIQTGAWTIASP